MKMKMKVTEAGLRNEIMRHFVEAQEQAEEFTEVFIATCLDRLEEADIRLKLKASLAVITEPEVYYALIAGQLIRMLAEANTRIAHLEDEAATRIELVIQDAGRLDNTN